MPKLIRCLQMLLLWHSIFVQVESNTGNPLSPPPSQNGQTTYKITLTEPTKNIRIIFSISYESVRLNLNDKFIRDAVTNLAPLFGIDSNRISELEITPDLKLRTVVTFKLVTGGVDYLSNRVALEFFEMTKVTDLNLTVGNVKFSPVLQYCNWTEGECPLNEQCTSTCSKSNNETRNLYPLLVLLIIPVIIVVVIALLWYFKYRRPSEKAKINLTELGYVENRSKLGGTTASRKGTISGISLADNGVRNEVYTTMGKSYGFSLDKADFDDQVKYELDEKI